MYPLEMFESAKNFFAYMISCVSEKIYSTERVFLPISPLHASQFVEPSIVIKQFEAISRFEQELVHHKVWELAKMENPQISESYWGRNNVFSSIPRLAAALYRLGFFQSNVEAPPPIYCLSKSFSEGKNEAQYFSLSERAAREPTSGQIGYVNGLGVPTLAHAGRDAASFSDRFADRNNLHCVYHTTHQETPSGDFFGFMKDVLCLKAVDGGSYTKTSYLIAQQWIDFLDRHPTQNYLQIAHSGGAVHVNAALRLASSLRPDLLSRIRVMAFCPAHFILPETYGHGLQVINLFKTQDGSINPWATGINNKDSSTHIVTVAHTRGDPHNHLSFDYVREGKGYVDQFLQTGNIYST